jgi:4-amino-4-deoxy-L-arabinose transferase-like glycosyltransferase
LSRLSAGTKASIVSIAVVCSRARWWAAVAIAAAAATDGLFRVPFLHVGLSPDEGGYAYVAEQWARGARLYGPAAWVDRPQGLMLAYRLLLSIAHSAWAIRLGALVCGVAITALLGAIGWMLDGPWTGAAAAAIYAIVSVGPHVQGFTFNGELAAALPATSAIAAALAWRRTRRSSWLVAAGLAGATGLLMKQSGFDGLVVAGALVAAGRWRRWRNLVVFGAAFLAPLAASVIAGAISGWRGYWFAVAGYKLSAHSGTATGLTGRLGRLASSWLLARPDLELLVLAALAGVGFTVLGRRRSWLPTGWLLAAFAGFNLASLYWPHYYVQLIPPLALLAALTATRLAARSRGGPALGLAVLVVAAIVWPVLSYLVRVDGMTAGSKRALVPYYQQYATDQRVAAAVRKLSYPHTPIYALDSEADLYFLADRQAAFPYLWAHPLDEIPGALERLRTLLDSPRHPPLVIVYAKPNIVDPTGRLGRILHDDYRKDERVKSTGITILRSSSA